MEKGIIINKISQLTNFAFPNSEVFLFGSQVRGDAKKGSDWDFLILLNETPVTFDTENQLINELYEIELETGEVISPLIYSKADWYSNHTITPLFTNIQKDGIRL